MRCAGQGGGDGLAGLFLFEEGKDFLGVAFRGDVLEEADEALVALGVGGSDEVGGSFDAFDQLAIHVFGLDEVEAVDENHVGVG